MSSVYEWKNQIFPDDHPAISHVRKVVSKLKIDDDQQRVEWSTDISLGSIFLSLCVDIPIIDVEEECRRSNEYHRQKLQNCFSMPYGILKSHEEGIALTDEFLRKAGYRKGAVLGYYDEESRQKRLKNKGLYDDAMDWVKNLALRGDPHAQYLLGGTLHDYRVGLDYEGWAYWTVKAALQGHYGAIFDLGSLIFDGLLPRRQRYLGKKCWQFLVDENIDIVRYEMENECDIRFAITKKLVEFWLRIRPKNYLERQAESEDVDSTVLYKLYYKYRKTWSKFYDPQKALYYLQRLIDRSRFGPIEALADHYYYGDIVHRDFEKALSLYRQAAQMSHGHRACEKLAIIFYEGVAVPQDLKESLKYFLLAIENRSSTAVDHVKYLIEERIFPESVHELVRQAREVAYPYLRAERELRLF